MVSIGEVALALHFRNKQNDTSVVPPRHFSSVAFRYSRYLFFDLFFLFYFFLFLLLWPLNKGGGKERDAINRGWITLTESVFLMFFQTALYYFLLLLLLFLSLSCFRFLFCFIFFIFNFFFLQSSIKPAAPIWSHRIDFFFSFAARISYRKCSCYTNWQDDLSFDSFSIQR